MTCSRIITFFSRSSHSTTAEEKKVDFFFFVWILKDLMEWKHEANGHLWRAGHMFSGLYSEALMEFDCWLIHRLMSGFSPPEDGRAQTKVSDCCLGFCSCYTGLNTAVLQSVQQAGKYILFLFFIIEKLTKKWLQKQKSVYSEIIWLVFGFKYKIFLKYW